MKTPRKFDSDAAHNAAATLPPAIDVNAIDDCTVDGIKQRSTTPTMRGDGRAPERKWEIPTPRTGNSANVDNSTAIWSLDRKSVVVGKSGAVRGDLGGRSIIKKYKTYIKTIKQYQTKK